MITIDNALLTMGLKIPYTQEELKKSYRQLAKKYHPDLHPGDKECERKMSQVNNANELLGLYLSDPIKAQRISQEAESRQREQEEAERRKEAAKKREEAEKRAKEAERKAREEREKRQREEYQRRAEQERKEQEARKKREQEENFRRNLQDRIQIYHSIHLFKLFSINENEYINDENARNNLDTNFNYICKCYNKKELYKEFYKRSHGSKSTFAIDKNEREKNRKVREYEQYIDERFGTLANAAYTYANHYNEYFSIGKLLGKTSLEDYVEYLFKSPEETNTIKKRVQLKLNKYVYMQSPFLSPEEQKEMARIDKSTCSRNYEQEISMQHTIEQYLEHNFRETKYSLYPAQEADPAAKELHKILVTSNEINEFNMSKLHFLYSEIINMSKIIYREIPEAALFNITSFSQIPMIFRKGELLDCFYELIHHPTFPTFREIYKRNINSPIFNGKNLHDAITIYDIYQTILTRYSNVQTISSFAYKVTIDDLLQLSEDAYKRLLEIATKNSKIYEENVRINKSYATYQQIFERYPETFKGMTYEKAMNYIESKCEFLKRQPFRVNLVEDFNISDKEIEEKIKQAIKNKKIKFIIAHNSKYHNKSTFNSSYNFDFFNSPEVILGKLSDEEIEKIYKETFIAYINKYHPELRISPADYDQMDEKSKESLLKDIDFDQRLKRLSEETYKYANIMKIKPMSYEDIRELSGKELELLENRIRICQLESAFNPSHNDYEDQSGQGAR